MKRFNFAVAFLLGAGVLYADGTGFEEAKQGGTKALLSYGQKMEKEKKFEEAVLAYKEVASTEKNVIQVQEALLKSSQVKVNLKDLGGAVNDLEKVLETRKTDPKTGAANHLTAVIRLAQILSTKLNDFPGAIALVDDFQKDQELPPASRKRLEQTRNSLLRNQVNSLVRAKKYEEARKLAADNMQKLPGPEMSAACINVEIAYSKSLTSKKQYDEADKVLRAAAQIKGAKPANYWRVQEAIIQNLMSKKDYVVGQKELDLLKKMPGGSKNNTVMAEVRFLLSSGKSEEAIDLLVKSAEDKSFKQKERGSFYNSAALNTMAKLHDVKRAEEYYEKAKSLLGEKFKNARLEKMITNWKKIH